MLRSFSKLALFVSLCCSLLAVASPAWAKGSVKLGSNRVAEDTTSWKLKVTIDYGSTPSLEYVPMIFSFKPVALYERSLTDASPNTPVETKLPLVNQPALNLPMDVGFGDPATGKRFNTTKFNIKLTRDADFEAGEYELTVKLASGGNVGAVLHVYLSGENKIVDRRSLVFGADSAAPKKKAPPPEAKADAAAKDGGAAEEQGPDLSGIADSGPDARAEAPAPPPVPPKQGGCALAPAGRETSATGILAGLGLALLGLCTRRKTKLGVTAGSALALATLVASLGATLGGCARPTHAPPPCPNGDALVEPPRTAERKSAAPADAAPTVGEAAAFVATTEAELVRLAVRNERANWVSSNFITSDTQEIAAEADEEMMSFMARTIKRAARYDGLELPADVRRKLTLLKNASTLPAPGEPAKTAELARVSGALKEKYGTGKYCPTKDGALRAELAKDKANQAGLACDPAEPNGKKGVTLETLSKVLAKSRDEAVLREAWVGWHAVGAGMRADYTRMVELANEGAREIGFADVGAIWRNGYDMPPEEFRGEADRLWQQVQPFYKELHCYARKRLRAHYGEKVVSKDGPIPAHLLGNMWSQTWSEIYPLLEPHKGASAPDVTKALEKKKIDEVGMVKMAERFYTSLGLDPLPPTFWERSLFKKPADREVQCHASAWDVHYADDLRIKMCIDRTEDELYVVHHELGHNYYYHYYHKLPFLFQAGANDGFHEAIGDAIRLSMTPSYLAKIGLVPAAKANEAADLNFLFKMALDKVSFLPFGKLIDEWRWDVFAGKIPADQYNAGWWRLRTAYQGILPPAPRTEKDFDPGAKYHVPSNVPYTRYFLAFIYQFQFHRALCRAAGHEGPLHTCSIFESKAAGDKLKALLALGAEKPWQEALAAMSGESGADANALLEYFAPLRGWLKNEVAGETCGW